MRDLIAGRAGGVDLHANLHVRPVGDAGDLGEALDGAAQLGERAERDGAWPHPLRFRGELINTLGHVLKPPYKVLTGRKDRLR
jgi:hypothetical protein